MRTVKEEFGPQAPDKLVEPLGEHEMIVRENLRTETRTRDDGTVETAYVCDSKIYTIQESVAVLQNRNDELSLAVAELSDMVLTGGNV